MNGGIGAVGQLGSSGHFNACNQRLAQRITRIGTHCIRILVIIVARVHRRGHIIRHGKCCTARAVDRCRHAGWRCEAHRIGPFGQTGELIVSIRIGCFISCLDIVCVAGSSRCNDCIITFFRCIAVILQLQQLHLDAIDRQLAAVLNAVAVQIDPGQAAERPADNAAPGRAGQGGGVVVGQLVDHIIAALAIGERDGNVHSQRRAGWQRSHGDDGHRCKRSCGQLCRSVAADRQLRPVSCIGKVLIFEVFAVLAAIVGVCRIVELDVCIARRRCIVHIGGVAGFIGAGGAVDPELGHHHVAGKAGHAVAAVGQALHRAYGDGVGAVVVHMQGKAHSFPYIHHGLIRKLGQSGSAVLAAQDACFRVVSVGSVKFAVAIFR